MPRWPAIVAALVTIGAIGLVLFWGVTDRAGTPPFETVVLVLTIATPVASLLLAWELQKRGHRGAALLCLIPLALMLIGWASAIAGRPLSLNALLWLDLYVLLTFAFVLARHGRRMMSGSKPNSGQ